MVMRKRKHSFGYILIGFKGIILRLVDNTKPVLSSLQGMACCQAPGNCACHRGNLAPAAP